MGAFATGAALYPLLAITSCRVTSSTSACSTGPGVKSFHAASASMAPTIPVNSDMLVATDYYKSHTVTRGDIVVLRPPPESFAKGVSYVVKRVIGLPGDTISADASGNVLINGTVLNEPWLPAGTPLGPGITKTTIQAGDYYAPGDNRANSVDSRYWGPISESLIVGRVETSQGKVCSP